MRKNMIVALIFTACTTSGCATLQGTADTISDKTGMNKAGSEATLGTGLGAAAGAIVGNLTGMGAGKGSLIGALFGAGIGYASGHERDIKEAEALAEAIRQESEIEPVVTIYKAEPTPTQNKPAQIAKADVKQPQKMIEPTDKKQAQKTAKQEYRFQDFGFDVPAGSLAAKSPTLQSALTKTGSFATTRKQVSAIWISGASPADSEWIEKQIRAGYTIGLPRPAVHITNGPLVGPDNKIEPVKIRVEISQTAVPNGVA